MRHLYLLILFAGTFFFVQAQDVNKSYLSESGNDSLVAGNILLKIENNNFLKNNEYFNSFTEGITYFGSQIQPELSYAFTQKTRLSLGWFLRYYYGREKFNLSVPVFRFEYEITPWAKLTFGQLHGLLAHQLIEPIYSTDNYFERNPENGIEFSIGRKQVHSNIWISWDHFILPGDDSQEEISSGINASWQLAEFRKKNILCLDLQGIIHHYGGQVDNSDSPLQTRLNLAPGLEFKFSPFQSNKTRISLTSYAVQASDQSSTVTIPFKKGWASYSYLSVNHGPVSLSAAYFHGEYYFSPLGDKLFQSVSDLNNWYARDTRNLLNGKFLLEQSISTGIKMGIRFESYYDLDKGNLDYWYGINILTDAAWLLNSRKK
jgi:hypothetical protein